jgi:hypothetical protein
MDQLDVGLRALAAMLHASEDDLDSTECVRCDRRTSAERTD